jgi:DNA-binding cell septation regulator SpoVG
MLEIQNINAINKGTLLATCDVHIIPWKMTLHEVKIFEKGANRWIGMPSREFINDAGEKKYIDLMTFDNEGVKNRFRSQIMGAIDKYLVSNPDLKPENVIKEDDDFPF